jgi:hypothetical protein
MKVEIMTAKHLPVMKHMTRSSDPYVELVLLRPLADMYNNSMCSTADRQGAVQRLVDVLVDVEHDLLTGRTMVKSSSSNTSSSNSKNDGDVAEVLGYHRTSVKVRFYRYNSYIKLHIIYM